MEAIAKYPGDEVHGIAAAAQVSGDIVSVAGLAGVVEGGTPIEVGDPICYRTKGVFAVVSASATTFSEGDSVDWDDAGKLAVATGTFTIGKAVAAKVNGDTSVLVVFNE